MRAHAAQIGAERILGEACGLLGRQHGGGVILVDVLGLVDAVAGDEKVVFVGTRLEHLDRKAAERLRDLLHVFGRTHGAFRQVVVDFLNRHPAAGAA